MTAETNAKSAVLLLNLSRSLVELANPPSSASNPVQGLLDKGWERAFWSFLVQSQICCLGPIHFGIPGL